MLCKVMLPTRSFHDQSDSKTCTIPTAARLMQLPFSQNLIISIHFTHFCKILFQLGQCRRIQFYPSFDHILRIFHRLCKSISMRELNHQQVGAVLQWPNVISNHTLPHHYRHVWIARVQEQFNCRSAVSMCRKKLILHHLLEHCGYFAQSLVLDHVLEKDIVCL